jgi:hypothetical protein
MDSSPVESNFVTRFVLGLAVIFAMFTVGSLVAAAFSILDARYAGGAGVLLGALATFVAFSVWYTRYDASWRAGPPE